MYGSGKSRLVRFDFSLVKTALAFSLIYCLMFNASVVLYKYQYYEATFFSGIFELLKQFIYAYIAVFIIFLGLALHRILFIAGALFLFLTGAIASYYLFYLGVAPTGKMMPAIYGAEISEVQELISVRIMIWIIFGLSICIFALRHFIPQTPKTFLWKLITLFCLFLTINNIISPYFRILKSYFPIQYLHNSYVYFFGREDYKRQDISSKFSFDVTKTDDDAVAVLVIGESARYGNLGINGYERDTTPEMAKIDNLYSFHGHSCENVTHLSITCLLSRYGEQDASHAKYETGILSILTSLGYNTTWISTQSLTKYYSRDETSIYDEVNFFLIPGGSVLYGMNAHDGVMLPYISKRLETVGRKVLVVQLSGSHWNYAERYPEEFTRFMPVQQKYTKVDPGSCDRQELINSYDNSILYTDFFLASLIGQLKERNAFLIYVSDHAESLGEEGRLGHGADYAPEQRDIPFIVWFSDIFKQKHLELASAINSHQGQVISHDYVFHSFLNCLGIESDIIENQHSLCSKR